MIEGERVSSFLRRDGFEDLHSPHVKDVNHSGRSDGDIGTPQRPIEEDNIGRATEVTDQRTSPVSKWTATNFPSSQAQKSCLARESRSRPWGPLEGIAKVSRISEGWLASIPTMSGGSAIFT